MHDADSLTPGSPKPRILVVEDDVSLCRSLRRLLSDEYTVETASNGREALSAVLKAPPLPVVTDSIMPELDGIGLLKALRSTRRTQMIPVLLISGHALDELRIEGFEEGADGYLAKPYTWSVSCAPCRLDAAVRTSPRRSGSTRSARAGGAAGSGGPSDVALENYRCLLRLGP